MNSFFFYLFMNILSISLFPHELKATSSKLPRLISKFSHINLRFMSEEGKFSYHQNRAGQLNLVKNFKSTEVLSSSDPSHFLVHGGRSKKRLLIEEIPSPHQSYNPFKAHLIYVVDYGGSKAQLMGRGRYPKLHLDDRFVSFYDMKQRKIFLFDLLKPSQKNKKDESKAWAQIDLNPKENPFFIPQILMMDQDKILYSDINSQGFAGLMMISVKRKVNKPIMKSIMTGTRFELCQSKDSIIIGEFPFEGIERKSIISKITPQKIKEAQVTQEQIAVEPLYESPLPDIGQLHCDSNSIYFIKTISYDIFSKKTEVAVFDVEASKKVTIKSDLERVTSFIQMDDKIIIPFRGEHFVVKGTSQFGEDPLLKSPED